MRNINVGIVGFGNIGAGVIDALLKKKVYLKNRLGVSVNLLRVCDKD